MKENFSPVDASVALEKVSQLRLLEWSYKGFSERHIGPMAQDFHTAFPLNPNSKVLNSADETGVALAAIQALNQKLNEEVAENADLKARLEKLETLCLQKK